MQAVKKGWCTTCVDGMNTDLNQKVDKAQHGVHTGQCRICLDTLLCIMHGKEHKYLHLLRNSRMSALGWPLIHISAMQA